jgi:glycosyltransferase involved in cell wall biosynthesis
MDRANYELARWLAGEGAEVHVVTHRAEEDLRILPGVIVHEVPRPLGAHALGSLLLDRVGRSVARAVVARSPDARVVVNGGNCRYPDANWVHAVHAAWPVRDGGAPLHVRAKNRVDKWRNRRDEGRALRAARVVLANSQKTRRELIERVGVEASRVHVVYLGCDPEAARPLDAQRIAEHRQALGVAASESMILFVGALGHDTNKGLDTLLDAFSRWKQDGAPAVRLFAVGAAVPRWQREVSARGLSGSVQLLGFRRDAGELVGAADLLVAPSRYDSYGLAVQEAICREVPAIVSSRAGVSERFPPPLRPLVLADPEDANELAITLARWSSDRGRFAADVARFAGELRLQTWARTAEQIVERIEASAPAPR